MAVHLDRDLGGRGEEWVALLRLRLGDCRRIRTVDRPVISACEAPGKELPADARSQITTMPGPAIALRASGSSITLAAAQITLGPASASAASRSAFSASWRARVPSSSR